MSDRSYFLKVDKEKLARDIMKRGGISIKDASIILGMKSTEAFRVKLSRGSVSLEDIIMLSSAAGLEMSIGNKSSYIFVDEYCDNPSVNEQLKKWKESKKEFIDAEIERLQQIKKRLSQ